MINYSVIHQSLQVKYFCNVKIIKSLWLKKKAYGCDNFYRYQKSQKYLPVIKIKMTPTNKQGELIKLGYKNYFSIPLVL